MFIEADKWLQGPNIGNHTLGASYKCLLVCETSYTNWFTLLHFVCIAKPARGFFKRHYIKVSPFEMPILYAYQYSSLKNFSTCWDVKTFICFMNFEFNFNAFSTVRQAQRINYTFECDEKWWQKKICITVELPWCVVYNNFLSTINRRITRCIKSIWWERKKNVNYIN